MDDIHILHVDDETNFTELASVYLENESVHVSTAPNVNEGKTHLENKDIDCIVSDYLLPQTDGLRFLNQVRRDYPQIPFIFFTSEEVPTGEITADVTDHVQKKPSPSQFRTLKEKIQNAVKKYKAEKEAKYNRLESSSITRTINDAIITVDESSTIIFANPAVEKIFGYSPEELEGKPLTILIPEELREGHERGFSRYLKTGEKSLEWEYVEFPGLHKQGDIIELSISYSEFEFDGDIFFTGVLRDITERKKKKEELNETKQLLEKTLESINEAILVVDPSNRSIVNCNSAVEEVFGYTPGELIGESTEILHVSQEMYEKFGAEGEKALDEKDMFETEFRMQRKDGSTIITRHTVTTLDREKGWRKGVVSLTQDITEQKRYERRSEILDRVLRHDIRNNISVITGSVDLLLEKTSDEEEKELLEQIMEKAWELEEISSKSRRIKDVISKDPGLEEVDIVKVVESTVEHYRELHPETDIEMSSPEEIEVIASEYINLAIENIIENAIEHNDKPRSEVDISVSEGNSHVSVRVEDNGPGIPETEIRVLKKGTETELEHMSGLGLWLTSWIIEQSGGEIQFPSDDQEKGVVEIRLRRKKE